MQRVSLRPLGKEPYPHKRWRGYWKLEDRFWMPQRAALIFLAIVLAALLPLLQIARPFVTPFILASILAIVMNPAKNWLGLRIHSPAIATFFTTITTILLLGTVLVFVSFALTQELTSAYDALSRRSLEEAAGLLLLPMPRTELSTR